MGPRVTIGTLVAFWEPRDAQSGRLRGYGPVGHGVAHTVRAPPHSPSALTQASGSVRARRTHTRAAAPPQARGSCLTVNFSLRALGGQEEEAGEVGVGGLGAGDFQRGEGAAGEEGLQEGVAGGVEGGGGQGIQQGAEIYQACV